MKTITEAEALNKAAAYCTLSEHCTSEVNNKLIAWGIETASRERIIEHLKKEDFINEQRYCRAFVNDKIRFNHWGRIKITAALHEKHLHHDLIDAAIAQIDEEQYLQILNDIIAIKRKEFNGKEDYSTNQKIIRFAAGRGFEPALILKIIKSNNYDEMDF